MNSIPKTETGLSSKQMRNIHNVNNSELIKT